MPEPHTGDPGQDELERLRRRRRERARRRHIINGLPLTRRLVSAHVRARGLSGPDADRAFECALVALVGAAAAAETTAPGTRFGAAAETAIRSALAGCATPGVTELAAARGEVEAALSQQDRVRQLSAFLGVPVDALVGGLLDAAASAPAAGGYRPLSGAA